MSAADEARAYLSTPPITPAWFGRALVTGLLAEHDAAVKRAEAAERELAEVRAEAADPYSPQHIAQAVKRAWRQRDEAVEAIAAERDEYVAELAELRERIGEPVDFDDVFEPGHTYRSENGYFEFHCERRIGEYALGIETVLKDWLVQPGTRFYRWASIGPSFGYIDVTEEGNDGH